MRYAIKSTKEKKIVIKNSEEYTKKIQTFLTDCFHSLQKILLSSTKNSYRKHYNPIIDKKKRKYIIQYNSDVCHSRCFWMTNNEVILVTEFTSLLIQ